MPTSQSTSLQQLIAAAGHIANPRIDAFTRLAGAVQRQRRELRVSDVDGITRSTALWTLMELDNSIRSVLQDHGVTQQAIADILSIRAVPSPSAVGAGEVHDDFARAMRKYLSEFSGQRPIDLPDVAVAILHAARDDSGGLLPDRLRSLKIDLGTTLPAIERLAAAHDSPGAETSARTVVNAGYLTDSVLGEAAVKDEIGIEADVDALARLIIDRDIQPPLSIGLFGDWGSGKSYFMRLMQQRVYELARRSARVPGREGSYCGDVRQITFNAWHYADDNLWASLLGRVFQGLGEPSAVYQIAQELADRGKAPPGGVLNYMSQRRRQAHDQLAEGQKEKKEAESRLDALKPAPERPPTALRVLAAVDVRDDPAIAAAKTRIAEEFGPDAAERAHSAGEATSALGRFARDLQVLWSLLRGGHGPRRRAAVAGGVILLAVVLALTVLAVAKPGWVKGLTAALIAAAAAVSLFARGMRAAVTAEADAAAEGASAQAEAHRQAAEDKIDQANADIAALEAGRAAGDYLADRAAEFRSRQGLVALIREELEQLGSALPNSDHGAERVVLYIDDLDRCGTRRVVQVLEAVHLLLAFPLFVVVVGVDARWLLSSLEDYYRTQFSGGLAAATPQQYLEKIFQIPFAIRPMDPAGFGRLMKSMLPVELAPTRSARAAANQAQHEPGEDHAAAGTPSPSGREPNVGRGDEVGAAPDHAPDDEVIGKALRVTRAELGFASTLQPIVRSPRAAKRLVNLYRIIRTSAMGAGSAEQLEQDYQRVLVLLALLVASPVDAVTVFSGVRAPGTDTSLSGLIESLRTVDDDTEQRDVLGALKRVVENDPHLDELAPYRRWLPHVARFSFDVALCG